MLKQMQAGMLPTDSRTGMQHKLPSSKEAKPPAQAAPCATATKETSQPEGTMTPRTPKLGPKGPKTPQPWWAWMGLEYGAAGAFGGKCCGRQYRLMRMPAPATLDLLHAAAATNPKKLKHALPVHPELAF